MKYDFIKVGATVCWHDPEGISEGEYKVASVPDNLEDDSGPYNFRFFRG